MRFLRYLATVRAQKLDVPEGGWACDDVWVVLNEAEVDVAAIL